jgi:hypothetical protein
MIGGQFARADFRGANLEGALLFGADLSAARGLDQDQLDEACGDPSTRLPSGLSVKLCHGRMDAHRILTLHAFPPVPPVPPVPAVPAVPGVRYLANE